MLALRGIDELIIDNSAETAKLQRAGQGIDLGGIAKGYIADEIKSNLMSHGIESAFVNLGGNALVIGTKPNGSMWKVGIQDPQSDRGAI